MQRNRSFKRSMMAWLLTFVMVASVIMVPAGKVKAAAVEVLLGSDSSVKSATADSQGHVEISFSAPEDYNTTDELVAAGIDKLQVTFKATSYTASGNAGAQAFINYDGGWESSWINMTQGTEQTVTLDLSSYLSGSSSITSYGIQFANITGSFSYQIISAKLIGPVTWDVENNDVSLSYTHEEQYDSYIEYKFTVKNEGSSTATGDLVIKFDQTRVKKWWTEEYTIGLSGDTLTISNLSIPAGSSTAAIPVQLKPTGASIVSVTFAEDGISAKGTKPSSSGSSSGGGSLSDTTTDLNLDIEYNYAKLLQESLYFYDANMCGPEVSDKVGLNWRGNCHTYDQTATYKGQTIDVSGGFHDAGDHVKFGLPQGYSATVLGMDYYVFKDAFDELGQTEHYKKIMDHFCDYFVRCTVYDSSNNVEAFCYQVGEGNSDHDYWGAPELQTTARPAYFATSSNPATDEVSVAIAALALHAYNFPNASKSATYLNTAEKLFAFVKNNSKGCATEGAGSFYSSSDWKDDYCSAAAALALATGKNTYTTELNSNYSSITTGWVLTWDNTWPVAALLKGDWDKVSAFASYGNTNTAQGFKFINYWGSARYNANNQFLGLAYDNNFNKLDVSEGNYSSWATGQMKYLLGNNTSKRCFVVGYNANSSKYPHHRAASKSSGAGDVREDHYTLLGALVGGPSDANDSYADLQSDYNCNEVALDYNAGFVGAAAGLYLLHKNDDNAVNTLAEDSELSTVGVTSFYHSPTNVTVPLTGITLKKAGESVTEVYMEKGDSLTVSAASTADIVVSPNPSDATLGKLTLASNKTSVVSVNNTTGKIIAVGKGTATITVTSGTGDSAKSAQFDVTVVITPTGINLSGDDISDGSISLETTGENSSTEVTASILPEGAEVDADKITWTVETGKTDIISVVKNTTNPLKATVTGLKKGTAKFTVSVAGTDFSKDCTVVVSSPVQSVTLDEESITLMVKGNVKGTTKLTPVITPADAAEEVIWNSTDVSVATVSNGVITAQDKGTATITAKVGSKEATCLVTVIKMIESASITDANNNVITSRTMAKGGSETFKVKVTPADATDADEVAWRVKSGSDYVSVDNTGKVTAIAKGSATIQAVVGKVIGEGEGAIDNTKTVTLDITVSNIVKDVTLVDDNDKTSSTISIGDTIDLSAAYTPSSDIDAPTSVTWESSAPTLVSVTQNATDPTKATVKALKSTGNEDVTITLTVVPAEGAQAITKEYKVKVSKLTQNAPVIEKIDIVEKTDSKIKVLVTPAASGGTYEYSFDGGQTWQAEDTKTGLSQATACEVMVRLAGDDNHDPSAAAKTATGETVKVKTGTLLTATTPYTIDLSKLPGGANYTDNTYLDSLYITYTQESQVKAVEYDKETGKLTLLPGRDYKLTGSNDTLSISFKQTENTTTDTKKSVTLEDAAVKDVDTDTTVNLTGNTTVKGDVKASDLSVGNTTGTVTVTGNVKADNVSLDPKEGDVKVKGSVDAGKVDITSGNVNVDNGIKASQDVAIKGGTVSVENGIKAANDVTISGGTVTTAGSKDNAAIEGSKVNITNGTVDAKGISGGTAISGKTVELAGGTVTATGGEGASAINATESITIKSNVKLSVNSTKNSDGTVASAINSTAITVEDGATITADDSSKTSLFSVVPKNQSGASVDVSKYTGGSSEQKADDKKSDDKQSDDKKSDDQKTEIAVKATDMVLTADVKGVKGAEINGMYMLAVKKSMTVLAAFSPEGAIAENITIVSSNPKVAIVSGNKITAKKVGTAKITVTSEGGLTKTFTVKVMKKAVSKVKIKAKKKAVKAGKTVTLKATISPSKKRAGNKIYWKSSNEAVATITQKGVIKGVKKGKVKIIATALDGSGKKASVTIKVK